MKGYIKFMLAYAFMLLLFSLSKPEVLNFILAVK